MSNSDPDIHQEQELLRLFKIESSKDYAFHQLIKAYQKRLYWHIRKLVISHEDTDDLLQETFIKAWNNLDKFREDARIYTWLYRIATNESLAFLKRKKKRFLFSIEDADDELSAKVDNPLHFNGNDIEKKLQKAVITLPEKQRVVFNMKYFDEMKYEEMSEVLGTSVGALKASYHHAVKKIEKYLGLD